MSSKTMVLKKVDKIKSEEVKKPVILDKSKVFGLNGTTVQPIRDQSN